MKEEFIKQVIECKVHNFKWVFAKFKNLVAIAVVLILLGWSCGCKVFKSKGSHGAKVKKEDKKVAKRVIKKEAEEESDDEVSQLRKRLYELQKKVELWELEGASMGLGGKEASGVLSEKALEEHNLEYEKIKEESSQVIERIRKRIELIDKQLEVLNGMKEKIDSRIEALNKKREEFLKLLEIKQENK